jgi:hypothetical protein
MRRSSVRGKDRTKRQFKVKCPPTPYSLFLFGFTPALTAGESGGLETTRTTAKESWISSTIFLLRMGITYKM